MIIQGSMGKIVIIEALDAYTFANELEQIIMQTNGEIQNTSIDLSGYKAIVMVNQL